MIGYFPHPYKDEVIYSIIARYHHHMRNKSKYHTFEELFSKKVSLNTEYINNVDQLSSKLNHFYNNLSGNELLIKHTTAPLYYLFNKTTYGGSLENRYRMISEVIDAVKTEWTGPLFVRISSTDYKVGGNTPETYVDYARKMKDQGVDLVDCSSGGIAPVKVDSYPNYQVPAADKIRKEVGIATGAVGLIKTGRQAEEILRNNRADLVFIGREFLKNPFWPRAAAEELGAVIEAPVQYTRYGSDWLKS